MSTVTCPVLGNSKKFWDVCGILGQVLGQETFFLGHFGTFRDISAKKKNPLNPVRNPLRRALDRSKPTNWTRYIRVTYSHFRTFWDILGKCEIWWENKFSASSFFFSRYFFGIDIPSKVPILFPKNVVRSAIMGMFATWSHDQVFLGQLFASSQDCCEFEHAYHLHRTPVHLVILQLIRHILTAHLSKV